MFLPVMSYTEIVMRVMKPTTLLLAMVLAIAGFSRNASADIITYAATAQGDFGSLDLTTGQYTSIGSSNVTSIVGMGFIGTTLYGVDNNPSGAGFYSISTSTGVASQISTLGVTAYGGTTDFGAFIGVTQDSPTLLFAANTGGNLLGTLNSPTFPADGLVAVGPGGNLFVSEYTGNPFTGDELHVVSTTDGTVTDIGGLNNGLSGPPEVGQQAITGIISGNTLYAIDGTNIYTYTVTPTSVSALLTTTAITGLNAQGDFVTAVAAVPEPTSLVMGSIAIAAAGLVCARRRFLSA
jgi:hypothetical protein